MFGRLSVAVLLVWGVALSKRVPVQFPFASTKEKPDEGLYYFPIPDTCPDECVYIPECGPGRFLPTMEEMDKIEKTRGYGNSSRRFIATGGGDCEGLYDLDPVICPITSVGECYIKCGGLRCATPEHNGFTTHNPLHPVVFEEMVQLHRKENNPKLNMFRFRDIAQAKYPQYKPPQPYYKS